MKQKKPLTAHHRNCTVDIMNPGDLSPELLRQVKDIARQSRLPVAYIIEESLKLGYAKYQETGKPYQILPANHQTGISIEHIRAESMKLGLPMLLALLHDVEEIARQTRLPVLDIIVESEELGYPKYRETLHGKPYQMVLASHQTGIPIEYIRVESIKLGLPILLAELRLDAFDGLSPLSDEESRRCFNIPDPSFDAFVVHCTLMPVPIPKYESLGHF